MKKHTFDWRNIRDLVELMYPVMPNRDLAELLGLTFQQVVSAGDRWNLKKEESVIRHGKAAAAHAVNAKRRAAPKSSPSVDVKPLGGNLPPRLTEAQLARRKKERFSYPDGLPFRARAMWGPQLTASDLSSGLRTSL